MAIIRKTDNHKNGQGHDATGTLIHCRQEFKMVELFWKAVLTVPQQVKTYRYHMTNNSILGTYPRETKTHIHANTCTQMFTAALRTTAKR